MICRLARSYSRRFPDDQLWRVLDTFYAIKAKGTGLGFTIAWAIVETYGGKIWTAKGLKAGQRPALPYRWCGPHERSYDRSAIID
jgi:signal transduction histidine kinase